MKEPTAILTLPREICRNLDAVLQREWLVTNGLGSYASGTVAGANTRRYHGLLVAALRPPVARTVMVAKVDEEVEYDQRTFYLGTNEYQDGTIHPGGFVHLESFALEDGLPVWLYRIGGPHNLMLEKRIWMEHGQQTTSISYRLLRQAVEHPSGALGMGNPDALGAHSSTITLTILPFTAYRDYHGQQYGSQEQHFSVTTLPPTVAASLGAADSPLSLSAPHSSEQAIVAGCTIVAFEGAHPYHLIGLGAPAHPPGFTQMGVWYWRFLHRVERERGLPDTEDYYLPGTFRVQLALAEHSTGQQEHPQEHPKNLHTASSDTFTLLLSAEAQGDSARSHSSARPRAPATSWQRTSAHQHSIARQRASNGQASAPALSVPARSLRDQAFLAQLCLAADQFIVARTTTRPTVRTTTRPNSRPNARASAQTHPTIIAGYHWFTDWSRDTMISLPGLTLTTGRFAEARQLLETFASYLNRGMLPNRFPDSGETLTDSDYNTVDATLWYLHAIDQYARSSGDTALLTRLFPALEEIIRWHRQGTRFNIHVDERDGLLAAGEPGVQLTWMDAKVDDWVVTPRIGKSVEINALWYNGLCLMEGWAAAQGQDPQPYHQAAARCRTSFHERFWHEAGAYLYDVVDGPDGDDASLRPNQLFALSLPHAVLEPARWETVLEAVTRHLLTPFGLRTLDQHHPGYRGQITGDRHARDGAYHQGTVWAWLIGPYLDARLRMFASRGEQALQQEEERCLSLLDPFRDHLNQYGLGTISEVFDGDPPHTARGCIAQAWSIAEVLRLFARCLHLTPALTPPSA